MLNKMLFRIVNMNIRIKIRNIGRPKNQNYVEETFEQFSNVEFIKHFIF